MASIEKHLAVAACPSLDGGADPKAAITQRMMIAAEKTEYGSRFNSRESRIAMIVRTSRIIYREGGRIYRSEKIYSRNGQTLGPRQNRGAQVERLFGHFIPDTNYFIGIRSKSKEDFMVFQGGVVKGSVVTPGGISRNDRIIS